MEIVFMPVVDTPCICKNKDCKKEFTILKENMLDDFRQCPFCGSLRFDYKDV
jgi:hypothetical protein